MDEDRWFVSGLDRVGSPPRGGRQIGVLISYLVEKAKWPYSKDVMYWDDWPVAHPFLIFGALQFDETEWFETWKRLDHSPEVEEVLRNLPVRNPLIWMGTSISWLINIGGTT